MALDVDRRLDLENKKCKAGESTERGRVWAPCADEDKKVCLGQKIIMLGI